MIPKSGNRFSEKIMLQEENSAATRIGNACEMELIQRQPLTVEHGGRAGKARVGKRGAELRGDAGIGQRPGDKPQFEGARRGIASNLHSTELLVYLNVTENLTVDSRDGSVTGRRVMNRSSSKRI